MCRSELYLNLRTAGHLVPLKCKDRVSVPNPLCAWGCLGEDFRKLRSCVYDRDQALLVANC